MLTVIEFKVKQAEDDFFGATFQDVREVKGDNDLKVLVTQHHADINTCGNKNTPWRSLQFEKWIF